MSVRHIVYQHLKLIVGIVTITARPSTNTTIGRNTGRRAESSRVRMSYLRSGSRDGDLGGRGGGWEVVRYCYGRHGVDD
jgi:hypothetical protein